LEVVALPIIEGILYAATKIRREEMQTRAVGVEKYIWWLLLL
jgi:hypothetical protein